MPDINAKTPQTISSVKLLICNTLKQLGHSPKPLCEAAGLSMPDAMHPMKRDDTPKVALLMKLAIDVTGDPNFAIQVAKRLSITAFSSFGAAIMSSPDLATALQRGQRFSELITGSASYEVVKEGGFLVARLFSTSPARIMDPNLVLLYIAGGLQVGRSLSTCNIIPVEIKLQQQPPENIEPYTALFSCPVLFSQQENSISLREEDLNIPIAAQDPRLSQLAQDLAVKDLNKLTARTIAEEVCVRIENSLADGEPKIAAVAASMGLSPRSLQRKLAAENQTYARLLDDTRKRMAHEMVLKPSEQIKNLAYDLGFSDQSNFNRAFKRWFSLSPTEYRRKFGEQ
ncbi:MAG: AraC family transcriptional regulator [Granulosicoccaceae bacterium]